MPTLQFKGKSVIETYAYTVPHHRLELVPDLSLLGKGEKPNLEGNLIIEGDNLLALKALLPTHAGRVKCIYIDPPYNTGNEGWVYNDNLTQPQFKEWIGQTVGKEGEDACRHDKWCCMMYPRLMLLRELLCDDGVILISIDDNEVSALRMIMEEVFGQIGFLACFVWRRRVGSSMASSWISADQEYILAFSKQPESVFVLGDERDMSKYSIPDGKGKFYASMPLTVGMSKDMRPNQWYELKDPKTGTGYWPAEGRVWGYYPPTMKEKIAAERIIWPDDYPDRNLTTPRYKAYPEDAKRDRKPLSTFISVRDSNNGTNDSPDSYSLTASGTEEGTRVLRDILGSSTFSYPKPVSLLRGLIEQFTRENDIVLDSFSGSGTTAQAVLEANSSDGGNRTFVIVQQEHDSKEHETARVNICRDVARERIKRVIAGYSRNGKGSGAKVKGLGGSFVYARVGEPLFNQYGLFNKKLPKWDDLAKYIFYTETSRQIEAARMKPESGFVGSQEGAGGTSYYLFYTPDAKKSLPMSHDQLNAILKKDKNRNWVIYCEKIWVQPDELRKFERENSKKIRAMQIPFQLR